MYLVVSLSVSVHVLHCMYVCMCVCIYLNIVSTSFVFVLFCFGGGTWILHTIFNLHTFTGTSVREVIFAFYCKNVCEYKTLKSGIKVNKLI